MFLFNSLELLKQNYELFFLLNALYSREYLLEI